MGGVFINYRAKDNPLGAASIHDTLARRFGYDRVFRDSVSMKPGEHYPTELRDAVERADVLVAVIGPRWNTLGGEDGGEPFVRRDRDWVRWEIARALERGIPVVPVLLTDLTEPTEPPDRDILPDSIRPLADRQNFALSQRSLGADLDRLAARLVELVPGLVVPHLFGPPTPPRIADSLPSTLLLPEYGVVPFDGRHLGDLRSWATGTQPGALRLLAGPPGCGKTRLAMELCTALRAQDWLAGLVPVGASGAEIAQVVAVDKSLLVVVDDAESRAAQLVALATALATREAHRGQVRVLLLGRADGNWLAELRRHADRRVAAVFRAMTPADTMIMDAGVTDPHARYTAAAAAFATAAGRTGMTPAADLTGCTSLLDIHIAALTSVLADSGTLTDPPLRRLLRLDDAHRHTMATAHGLADLDPAGLDAIGTVATLCRPASDAQADAVRERLGNFLGDVGHSVGECVEFLDRLRPAAHSLAPVLPAALGEELVATTLAGQPSIVTTLAANCTDEQIGNALTVLGQAYGRRPELAGVLTDLLRVDLERLVPIAVRIASRLERPAEFSRLISTALRGSTISPTGIFDLMDQLSDGNRGTDPVRAAVFGSLMDWANQLTGQLGAQTKPPDSPLTDMFERFTTGLTGFATNAMTGFLDPASGAFPKDASGRDVVPPDLLNTMRMLMERKARWEQEQRDQRE